MNYQKETQEEEITISKDDAYKLGNTPLRKLLPIGYLNSLDKNQRYFCKEIKKNLHAENYEIMAITGYAGCGKSQLAAIFGALIDDNYNFIKNINFIPTSTEIEKSYYGLKPHSFLHIDEASRSIHKHKWYEKSQQKLAMIYDTDRENYYHCSCLIMPRFQNFSENFRNFFIKYWVNIIARGVAIVYRRDEDKDTRDPWNLDENFKLKSKFLKGKRVFERSVSDIITIEQRTKNYWFYFQIPEVPKDVWNVYKFLKKESRVLMKESEANLEVEDYREKCAREKMDRWKQIVQLRNEGKTYDEISILVNKSVLTIKRDFKEIATYNKIKGVSEGLNIKESIVSNTINNIYTLPNNDNSNKDDALDNKVQKDKLGEGTWDTNGLIKKD